MFSIKLDSVTDKTYIQVLHGLDKTPRAPCSVRRGIVKLQTLEVPIAGISLMLDGKSHYMQTYLEAGFPLLLVDILLTD